MNDIKLPENYIPFPQLIICSNIFNNGKIPIIIKGNIPFLVGNNDNLLIWLSGPLSENNYNWRDYIIKNESLDKRLKINIENNSITVLFKSTIIIKVIKKSSEIAEIIKLDLRPLGLNIYGNENELIIGKNKFVKNSFIAVETMIAID